MTFWLSKKKNQASIHEIEVNVMGLFDRKFLKESFTLNISGETPLEEALKLIDKKLRINLFSKFKGNLPANWMVLANGNRIDSPIKNTILLKSKDQLSIISALGGG